MAGLSGAGAFAKAGSKWNPKSFGSIAKAGASGAAKGGNPDPYNWKGIAAQLAAQKKKSSTKKAAQKRVTAAAKPKAARASAPAAPAVPVQTPKQLLDAFRAANGGALPPGMTPETAGLIDAGIDIATLQTANPAAANALLLIQQQLLAMPGAYDASRAKITADYNALTGDVTTAGQEWMNTLYGNVVNPGDPNAAQFAADPSFANYANNLGQIEETGDINEATDLAWFTKNQQAQQAYLESLRMGVAGGTIPVGAAIDGGGGGGGGGGGRGRRGGGRRGYGGYGGGGYGDGYGDSGWSDPKTVSTRTEQLTGTGTDTVSDFNVDFLENLIAGTEGNPELRDLAMRQWALSNQTPQGMTTQLAKTLTDAEAQEMEYGLQDEKRAQWLKARPTNVQNAVDQWRNNIGLVRGDDPRTEDVKEMWHIPAQNAGRQINNTEEQKQQNILGEQLHEARSNRPTAWNFGNLSNALGTEMKLPKGHPGFSKQQAELLETSGADARRAAQNAATSESPWSWANWSGQVDEPNKEERSRNQQLIDFANTILNITTANNPNATPQLTKSIYTLQDQERDQLQTKNKSTNPNVAVGGNPQGVYPGGVGAADGQFFGGAATPTFKFDNTPLPAPNYGTGENVDPVTGSAQPSSDYIVSPFGEGAGIRIPEERQAEVESLRALAERRLSQDRGAIGSSLSKGLGGFGKAKPKSLSTPKLTAKPKAAVAAAKQQPKSSKPKAAPSSGRGNTRTRQLADGQRTPAAAAPAYKREVGMSKSAWMSKYGTKGGKPSANWKGAFGKTSFGKPKKSSSKVGASHSKKAV